MIDAIVDKYVIGALFICLILAVPLAVVSLIYGVLLLGMFSALLIPLGFVWTAQWACERCRRWYGR